MFFKENVNKKEKFMDTITPKNKTAIPVCFSTDENYYLYLAVAIKSLIVNKKADTEYDIIIFETGLDSQQKSELLRLSTNDTSIRIFDISGISEKYGIKNFMTINHLKESAYYRLLISEILSEYKKVIYLDCDLIVLTDLSEMYNVDIKNKYAAVVKDYFVSCLFSQKEDFIQYAKDVLNIDNLDLYFNSGVMLFNLELIRLNNVQKKLLDIAKINNRYFHDQNVLNSCFFNKCVYLDGKYNVQWHLFFKEGCFPPEIWAKYLKELSAPKILHYTSQRKPWKDLSLPNADIWWKYACMTPFYDRIKDYIKSERRAYEKYSHGIK